jgi:hypothetical protein
MDALPSTAPTVDASLLTAAQTENARLIAMLEAHGIDWRLPPEPIPALLKMWDKRQRGYRAMGYRIGDRFALDGQEPETLLNG